MVRMSACPAAILLSCVLHRPSDDQGSKEVGSGVRLPFVYSIWSTPQRNGTGKIIFSFFISRPTSNKTWKRDPVCTLQVWIVPIKRHRPCTDRQDDHDMYQSPFPSANGGRSPAEIFFLLPSFSLSLYLLHAAWITGGINPLTPGG
ncbi:hypothetical protein BDV59DRAFT_24411 [Aspergillus ambiguus]|uniref:uncharacterized protein n=1 Tax=Aspergillus ambiguus TaxID=176160 RepID=UPI003CCD9C49